jgi:hypothetical protein
MDRTRDIPADDLPVGAPEGLNTHAAISPKLGGPSNLCRSLFISFYSRGFGHTGLRHFFRDAGKKCFVGLFLGFRFCHTSP